MFIYFYAAKVRNYWKLNKYSKYNIAYLYIFLIHINDLLPI